MKERLKGITVLDCSALVPGPSIGKRFADYGARVIKVENPHIEDGAKVLGKTYYQSLNHNKEIRKLDLKSPSGQEEFQTLVDVSDALIESFRPQAKEKLGLTAGSLHRINPKLSILSLVGYPEEGEKRDHAGHDLNFQALSGVLAMYDGKMGLPLADLFVVERACFDLMAAIYTARKSGRGERVVVSFLETMKDVQRIFATESFESPEALKLFKEGYPCYGVYHCQCKTSISLGAVEHKFWLEICRVLGLKGFENDGYSSGPRGEETRSAIQSALEREPWTTWQPLFEKANCCVEPVLSYKDVFK